MAVRIFLLRRKLRERLLRAGEARATAWLACQKIEALQQIWRDLFKAAARATR